MVQPSMNSRRTSPHESSESCPSQDIYGLDRSAITEELLSKGLVWKGDGMMNPTSNSHGIRNNASLSFNIEEIDNLLPAGGIACGAVHELYYHDPTNRLSVPSYLPSFLAYRTIVSYYSEPSSSWDRCNTEQFPFLIVWIGRRCWPTPHSLPLRLLRSSLFIDPPTDRLTLWSIESSLRSPAVKLVVSECPRISLATTIRLNHVAKTNHTTALLLRQYDDLMAPSSCATKWLVSPTPSSYPFPLWRLSLIKVKGGSPTTVSWTIGMESGYGGREEIPLRVFSTMVDRRYQEEATFKKFGT
jgi:hypothetical protein